jgi:hypothetical protein
VTSCGQGFLFFPTYEVLQVMSTFDLLVSKPFAFLLRSKNTLNIIPIKFVIKILHYVSLTEFFLKN